MVFHCPFYSGSWLKHTGNSRNLNFSPWHKQVDTNDKQIIAFHFGSRTDCNNVMLRHRILWNASSSQTQKKPLMKALTNAPVHFLGKLESQIRHMLQVFVRKCQLSFSKVIWTICGRVLKNLRREKGLIKKINSEIIFLLLKNNSRKEGDTFAKTFFMIVVKETRGSQGPSCLHPVSPGDVEECKGGDVTWDWLKERDAKGEEVGSVAPPHCWIELGAHRALGMKLGWEISAKQRQGWGLVQIRAWDPSSGYCSSTLGISCSQTSVLLESTYLLQPWAGVGRENASLPSCLTSNCPRKTWVIYHSAPVAEINDYVWQVNSFVIGLA